MKKGLVLVEMLVALLISTVVLSLVLSSYYVFNTINIDTVNQTRDNYYLEMVKQYIVDHPELVEFDDNGEKKDIDDTNACKIDENNNLVYKSKNVETDEDEEIIVVSALPAGMSIDYSLEDNNFIFCTIYFDGKTEKFLVKSREQLIENDENYLDQLLDKVKELHLENYITFNDNNLSVDQDLFFIKEINVDGIKKYKLCKKESNEAGYIELLTDDLSSKVTFRLIYNPQTFMCSGVLYYDGVGESFDIKENTEAKINKELSDLETFILSSGKLITYQYISELEMIKCFTIENGKLYFDNSELEYTLPSDIANIDYSYDPLQNILSCTITSMNSQTLNFQCTNSQKIESGN